MEQDNDPRLLDDLLGPLHMHFLVAARAYADYLAAGKSFLFASSLRRTNASARELLIGRGWRLPEDLQADAAALVRHYDAWLTLWDEHCARLRPGPGDPFVFANEITYPREAEARLEALYRRLSGAGDKAGGSA
ncbi:MAG TPA: hypothetical protein VF759_02685 [Allosphingosinicella sp.]